MNMEDNIVILDNPLDIDTGAWMVEHPDCDAIIEDVENSYGQRIRVFAYAVNELGNDILETIRNHRFSHMSILKGVSRYAIGGIF